MLQAFVIILREGVESFLIVAVILAYLRKTSQSKLIRIVAFGILGAVITSGLLGYFLWLTQGAKQPLIEGILGLVTVFLVATFVMHMWKVGPTLKSDMEKRLSEVTAASSLRASALGVFWFTLVMLSREGMETALLLFQIHEPKIVAGVLFGILGAGIIAYIWQQFGYRIKLKHFFQVTAIYLLLFTVQIAIQSFHEFSEAGILPNSVAIHTATEPFSTDGIYGKWFTWLTVIGCGLWLAWHWLMDKIRPAQG